MHFILYKMNTIFIYKMCTIVFQNFPYFYTKFAQLFFLNLHYIFSKFNEYCFYKSGNFSTASHSQLKNWWFVKLFTNEIIIALLDKTACVSMVVPYYPVMKCFLLKWIYFLFFVHFVNFGNGFFFTRFSVNFSIHFHPDLILSSPIL